MSTGRYAERTTVSFDRSIEEIRATLKRYGASRIGVLEEQDGLQIAFEMAGRRVRLAVRAPKDNEVDKTPTGRYRTNVASAKDAEYRRRARALLLMIKARLESIASEMETFDQAFLPYILLPSGQRTDDWLEPQIEAAYASGVMPRLLLAGGER